MFHGSEYRRTVIGAFPESAIAGEQLARDVSVERRQLEVAEGQLRQASWQVYALGWLNFQG